MKYSYSIKELDMNGYKTMYFCLEDGLEPVTNFINTDISSEKGANLFINKIKRVLEGDVSSDVVSGNSSVLTIKHDFVDVEEMFFGNKVVSIEPTELILLIEAFVMEKKNYDNSHNIDI